MILKHVYSYIVYIHKETEGKCKNKMKQIELVEMKSTMREVENTLDGFPGDQTSQKKRLVNLKTQ